jgi:hypothetical protein
VVDPSVAAAVNSRAAVAVEAARAEVAARRESAEAVVAEEHELAVQRALPAAEHGAELASAAPCEWASVTYSAPAAA